MRRALELLSILSLLLGAAPGRADLAAPQVILGAEDNRLRAYDPVTGHNAVVIPSAADDPRRGRDINAQICADPANPRRFIAGEDTNQDTTGDPGWGYFELFGNQLDRLRAAQLGKLVPTYSNTTDNPENYGCGFLSGGRLLTTDVGDQQPFAGANGQLILWFPPFSSTNVAYCKIDVGIATAGGIWVEGDTVFVAANRPALPDGTDLGGIYEYTGAWPTGPTAAQGCGRLDATGAPLVDAGRITKTRFITGEPLGALTPSAIVSRPGGGYYVSSVLTGVIAQYDRAGAFVRRILEPPLIDLPPYTTGTPYGLAVDAEGSVWYADIGVTLTLPAPGPGDHNGSVRRIRFDGDAPRFPETMASGLAFPDGLGVVALRHAPSPPPRSPAASSTWPCGNWGMYGANAARTFSRECPSSISQATAPTLVPAWIVKTPKTVTASPVIVDGRVFVGDWSGQMYALNASNGALRWRYQTVNSPGAAFGPIVSTAAVAEVTISGATKRLVIFGAGPRLYALDAANGSLVWKLDESMGLAATPAEIESSPVVFEGVVYVGIDTHNNGDAATGGVRGGLLAVDATTGALLWEFNPELLQSGVGCGSVWSSPTIDTVNRLMLLATGNCEAPPETFTWNAHTEAVTAIRIDGRHHVAWTFQPHGPNRADLDFGATPNILTLPDGTRRVGIGNKDAVYYALDPATGALVWSRQVAQPGNVGEDFAIGGFIGSTATWRGDVYGGTALGGPPWYHALDGTTGASKWSGLAGPSYAASAVVNGVVFAGDLTGTLKAFHADNGLPLGIWPVLGPISSAPAMAGDLLVVGAGTASSDLCAKGSPGSEPCAQVLDLTLGSLGGVHAFKPLTLGWLLTPPPVVVIQ